jgi:hypothetical protein
LVVVSAGWGDVLALFPLVEQLGFCGFAPAAEADNRVDEEADDDDGAERCEVYCRPRVGCDHEGSLL